MADLLADMERRRQARKFAIQEGIAKRLPELGFVRKSGKLYLREDDRFSEWVRFEYAGSNFGDFVGVFDKQFDVFFRACLPDRDSASVVQPWAAHAASGTVMLWRQSDDARKFGRRTSRGWWNLYGCIRDRQKSECDRSPFVTEMSYWHPDDDPEGCAALSRVKWEEHVEPWRTRVRSEKRALIESYRRFSGGDALERIVCHVYLDEPYEAESICRELLDKEGLPPPDTVLRERLRFAGPKVSERQFIANWINGSIQRAKEVRRIGSLLALNI